MKKPSDFRELIDSWPEVGGRTRIQTLAADLQVTDDHVHIMKYRNQISTIHWRRLLIASKKRSMGVTMEDLMEMREAGQSPVTFPTLVNRKSSKALKAHVS
jgi:hypothetical protein